MRTEDKKWAKTALWLLILTAEYTLVALHWGLPQPMIGLFATLCLALGWGCGAFNTSRELGDPLFKADYFIFPILSALLMSSIAIAAHCPWLWVPIEAICFIVGYAAGAPGFGDIVIDCGSYIFTLPAAMLIITLWTIDCIVENWKRIVGMLFSVLFLLALVLWVIGCITANLTLVAISIGFFAGTTFSAQTSKKGHLYANLFWVVCGISLFLLAWRPGLELEPHQPLVAVCCFLVALIVAGPEHDSTQPAEPTP